MLSFEIICNHKHIRIHQNSKKTPIFKSTGTSSRAFMNHLEAFLKFGSKEGFVELISENRLVVDSLSGIVGKAFRCWFENRYKYTKIIDICPFVTIFKPTSECLPDDS